MTLFGESMSPEFKAWEEIGNRTDAVAKDYWRLVVGSKDHATELASVRAAIAAEGVWKIDEEWRVMTWTSVCIRKTQKEEHDLYLVSVICDGQKFECDCPDLERAYHFACWYQHLIVHQYYSIGPNWADAAKR